MTPQESPRVSQRGEALVRANKIRLARAALHNWVREPGITSSESRARAVDVLRKRDEAVRTLRVQEFLLWPRRWGTTRARKLLVRLRIGEERPLGALTDRQVRMLARALEGLPPEQEPGGF